MSTPHDLQLGRPDENLFVARQPIIDRRGRCTGQELLFRDALTNEAQISDDFLCTAAVVERVLGSFGMDALVGELDAYLNRCANFLFSDLVDVLPSKRFVLEVLETNQLSPELAQRCKVLRQLGFRIALDDVRCLTPEMTAFLPSLDIIKIDWPYVEADGRWALVRYFKTMGKTVLAEKVETRDDHGEAMESGCDLFQGYYFAKPQTLCGRRVMPTFSAVLNVFRLVTADTGLDRLANALTSTPMLVKQQLRLANSGSQLRADNAPITLYGRLSQQPVTNELCSGAACYSMRTRTGCRLRTTRWFASWDAVPNFMEWGASVLAPADCELQQSAYLTGVLSLLHVAHGVEPEAFLKDLPISAGIRNAIVTGLGSSAPLVDFRTA